jgi:hypothetical protein
MRDQNISYTGETGEDLDHTFDTVVKQKCYKGVKSFHQMILAMHESSLNCDASNLYST